ncbi:PH domain-containing protein [Nocardioidaceae bacterium]|nr:PH domain-containing protein [Nocardioidaceae bacterium]
MIDAVPGGDIDLAPDEDLVVRLRRHPTALIVPLLVVAAAAIPAGVVASFVPDPARGPLTVMAWLLAAVAVLWWAVRPAADALTAHHGLTNRRLVLHQGIVSRRGSTRPRLDIPLTEVEAVAVEDTLFGRVVGVGTLVVHRAGAPPVRLRDVPDAGRLQVLVEDLADAAHVADRDGS